ncbi:hypothetical protein [Polyangium aurulentum]|uniref:hypothetical protein n=1 Tax=Polyangium aurulentum TaxID=2567896 RepID=UPI0010AE1F9F|nr:hypothetical protein [Polyangium aurulentum]UQA61060.1 hypothetical protein E8A73_011510 [Polyangium aurulentum]
MESWARELLDVWKTNIPLLAKAVVEKVATNENVVVKYSPADVEQLGNGILAMMEEELEGRGRDVYATYLQSVVPAVIMQGEQLENLVRVITLDAVIMQQEIVPRVSEQHRERAAVYLMNWWANHNADVVRIVQQELTREAAGS